LKTERISSNLDDFAQRVEALTQKGDIQRPWPTLRILGRRNKERLWQQYLAYFLNPNRPHGFNGEFLEEILKLFANKSNFSTGFIHPDLERIEIETEATGSEGRPDIVIHHNEKWFVCIEMKVDSGFNSGQLERYSKAKEFGNVTVSNFDPERRLYIYIDTSEPDKFKQNQGLDHKFRLCKWEDIARVIDTLQSPPNGHYPIRSIEQLRDFRNLIATKTNMNENSETIRQLKEEYIKNREAIDTANEAGEEFVAQELAHEWVHAITEDDQYRPYFWDDTWRIKYRGNSDSPGWGQFYKEGWKQNGDLDIDIHFEHEPKWKHFREGKMVFTLEIEGETPNNNAIKNIWNKERSSIKDILPETSRIQSPGGRNKYALKSKEGCYKYNPGDPDAYFESLKLALEDHSPVADVVDEIVAALPLDDLSNFEL